MAAKTCSRLVFQALVVSLTCISGCGEDKYIKSIPTAVVATASGGMNFDTGWKLSVNSSGRASLVVGSSSPRVIEFTVPPERLSAFSEEVTSITKFPRGNEQLIVGRMSPDEVTRTLVVVKGDNVLSVSFHSLESLTESERATAAPYVRLRHQVRSWMDSVVNDDEVLDMRSYESAAILTNLGAIKGDGDGE